MLLLHLAITMAWVGFDTVMVWMSSF